MVAVLLSLALVSALPQKIAVMDIRADGGADPVIGSQLTARVAEVLGKRPKTRVTAPDDLRALLEQEGRKQLAGCTDDSCLAEIAGALGVDAIVAGRISKIERGYALSMSLIDARDAHALGHVTETWGGESIALLDLVAPMIDTLFAGGNKLVGSLEIEGAVSGSKILIDEQVRGTAPAGQMANIPIGARKIQVLADDYQAFERWVVVKNGELVTVPVQQTALESSPFYATWWFWTVTGVVVAGAAVGSAVALSGGDSSGETGVSISANADSAFGGSR